MKKGIAFFDFDGTITTKDTMLELIKYHFGIFKFLKGFAVLSPYMLLMKTGLISNQYTKEKLLAYFFKGMEIATFEHLCGTFVSAKLPSLIRPAALETIERLKQEDMEIVVVSASAENWVKGWCIANNIIVISSQLEITNGRITGRLIGKNCHGLEKVSRIKKQFDLSNYQLIKCFGDTGGDKPMLSLAHESFYKPFRQ